MNQHYSHSQALRGMVGEHRNGHSHSFVCCVFFVAFFVLFRLFVLRHLRFKNVLLKNSISHH